jgi:hypothetical protein
LVFPDKRCFPASKNSLDHAGPLQGICSTGFGQSLRGDIVQRSCFPLSIFLTSSRCPSGNYANFLFCAVLLAGIPANISNGWFCTFLLSHFELLQSILSHFRLRSLLSLLPYLCPKRSETEQTHLLILGSQHQHSSWWRIATRYY